MAKTSQVKLVATILCSFVFLFCRAQESYLLVGTYDSPKSEGIYVYKFNSIDGSVKEISHIKTSNPSFLAISPNEKYVYAVNETADSTGKGGRVSSFSFDKKQGTLRFLNQQSSEGNHPCYIATNNSGDRVMVVNYSTGNFAMYVSNNGILDTASMVIQQKGSGPDTVRQKSSHLHGIFLHKNTVMVTDLGADEIISSFAAWHDKKVIYKTKPGAGPRHLAFHKSRNIFYSLNELNSTIEVFKNRNISFQTISTLPMTYKGPVGGSADIHISPDGRFLYVSNRGQSNSIGIYSVDKKTGFLKAVDHISSGGKAPRHFNFDPTGNFLLVGNQMSDEIAIFKVDKQTGKLTDTMKRISIGRPVCIKWISP